MSVKRAASCPLCGAKMAAAQLLDACEAIIHVRFGVLACHCPYCQGYLEVVPAPGQVDIGYLVGQDASRFDVVLSLPYAGLEVESRAGDGTLLLRAAERQWTFAE